MSDRNWRSGGERLGLHVSYTIFWSNFDELRLAPGPLKWPEFWRKLEDSHPWSTFTISLCIFLYKNSSNHRRVKKQNKTKQQKITHTLALKKWQVALNWVPQVWQFCIHATFNPNIGQSPRNTSSCGVNDYYLVIGILCTVHLYSYRKAITDYHHQIKVKWNPFICLQKQVHSSVFVVVIACYFFVQDISIKYSSHLAVPLPAVRCTTPTTKKLTLTQQLNKTTQIQDSLVQLWTFECLRANDPKCTDFVIPLGSYMKVEIIQTTTLL